MKMSSICVIFLFTMYLFIHLLLHRALSANETSYIIRCKAVHRSKQVEQTNLKYKCEKPNN